MSPGESERAVLGSVLLDNNAFAIAANIVTADDFAEVRQPIWDAMSALSMRGDPIDFVTLQAELRQAGSLERVGGVPVLAALTETVPTAANARFYAEDVREMALGRKLRDGANDAAESAGRGLPTDQVSEQLHQTLTDVAKRKVQAISFSMSDILTETNARIESIHKGESVDGVPTGLPELDAITAGLPKKGLTILAGRPGMGKTAFMLMLVRMASVSGFRCGVLSLEMPREQLMMRLISMDSGVPVTRMRKGECINGDWSAMAGASGALSELPIRVVDEGCYTPFAAVNVARMLHAEHGLSLLVIDYLQLMRFKTGHGYNRDQAIGDACSELKELAKQLDISVVVLAQLSRKVEERPNKRPMLSDLRDSGNIEQAGDLVLFLFRPEYYNEGSRPGEADLIVAKQRQGGTGTVVLHFNKQRMLFQSNPQATLPMPSAKFTQGWIRDETKRLVTSGPIGMDALYDELFRLGLPDTKGRDFDRLQRALMGKRGEHGLFVDANGWVSIR